MKAFVVCCCLAMSVTLAHAQEETSYYDGSGDELLNEVLSQMTPIFEFCEVDYNSLLESSTQMMGALATGTGGQKEYDGAQQQQQQTVDSAVQQLQELAQPCSAGQAQIFERALNDFQTCSSIDLRTVLESFADALLGTLLQCTLTIAPLADQIMEDPINWIIPDICIESFMGRNPVGDLVRSSLLFPDKTLPCFSSLSKAIPECTLEEWPIPMIGKLMKKITCVLGNTVDLVDEMAKVTMLVLSECLLDSNSCEDNLAACAEGIYTMLLPKPLQGTPLSDAMIRAAQEDASVADGVVERYDHFVETCIPDRWAGWSYAMGDYEGSTTYTKQQTSAVDTSAFAQEPVQQPKASNTVTTPVESSSSSPVGPFLGGLVTGLVLIGGVWAFTLSKKRNTGEGRYLGVEMASNDLTLV
eukprot:scaffold3591_cov159-Amphora_coffeaeformis.AAC.12